MNHLEPEHTLTNKSRQTNVLNVSNSFNIHLQLTRIKFKIIENLRLLSTDVND